MGQVEKAAQRMESGILAEALALEFRERKDMAGAARMFSTAKRLYQDAPDKLRQDFHLIALEREAGRKDLAITHLKEAGEIHGDLPEAAGLKSWLDILDPPPPPAPAPPAAKKASP